MKNNESSWKYTGMSVIGTSHEKSETPCQDACTLGFFDGLFVAVVADGAGSAKHSDIGSKLLTEEAFTSIQQWEAFDDTEEEWEKHLLNLAKELRKKLEKTAKKQKLALKDLAATLVLVIVSKDRIVGLQIGDGAIVYGSQDEQDVRLLISPVRGEYLNETTFITSDNYQDVLQIVYDEAVVDRVAVFSDGLQMLSLDMKIDPPEPYQAFFQPFFASLYSVDDNKEREKHLEAFLQSPRVCERTDDDKTFVFASRKAIQGDATEETESAENK